MNPSLAKCNRTKYIMSVPVLISFEQIPYEHPHQKKALQKKCFFQLNSPLASEIAIAMKYAVAYEIFASQMFEANFISHFAFKAKYFIIRKDYFMFSARKTFH